jgi:hypothetical protein
MNILLTPLTPKELENKTVREKVDYLLSYPCCLFLDLETYGELRDLLTEMDNLDELNQREVGRIKISKALGILNKVKVSAWDAKVSTNKCLKMAQKAKK